MKFPRSSGILLHPTSLPNRFGIGSLGHEAHSFARFLGDAGQKIWQVLPLGPTGYGDSPYQLFSAFAGNPLLISLDGLVEEGTLTAADLAETPVFPEDEVDFGRVLNWKLPLLEAAARRFEPNDDFAAFCGSNASWLEDFALFMALKRHHGGVVWTQWDHKTAGRDPNTLAEWRRELQAEIAAQKYWQFVFFRQWGRLKDLCHSLGIRLMGDVPIYVAHDSADVWQRPDLFQLDERGNPKLVAGVPPDYFSATGQLWGNPIYRWDRFAESGYAWWIERLRAAFAQVDMVRLDHFRGFQAYWEVPATESTAINGRWVAGPGKKLFEACQSALGDLPIVAENLGVITPEVEAIRHRFDLPGMAILQFAFGKDPQGPSFRPHNYPRDVVAYTGTHDNDTTIGWWTSTVGEGSTRTEEDIRKERAFALAYLNSDGREIHWDFVRALMASVANTVLVPAQDLLGLGNDARMNLPGKASGNWRWRLREGALTKSHASRLRDLAKLYDR